ncbi:hypothetical protein [Mycolicibacterium sp. OfavD-34-C]|uniref:hypothetical protein n=1 Tax=Mycolicibacterium sp. OfavD-34-C TaxID=2917746 RepID=UPI001EF70171|nr:hypothetical protein [Mycolicibacterium sp. OfavD-34-C]MCG7580988.1 hypothetical protein [Mycolicibacterium sp. OfavD-34-C]
MRRFGIARTTYVAYVLVLMSLALLGVFVAALALGARWAPFAGVAMLAALVFAVLGFRHGGAQLARARSRSGYQLSMWVDPLRAEQLARYRAMYRHEPDVAAEGRVVSLGSPPESTREELDRPRLSA